MPVLNKADTVKKHSVIAHFFTTSSFWNTIVDDHSCAPSLLSSIFLSEDTFVSFCLLKLTPHAADVTHAHAYLIVHFCQPLLS